MKINSYKKKKKNAPPPKKYGNCIQLVIAEMDNISTFHGSTLKYFMYLKINAYNSFFDYSQSYNI